LLKIPPIDKFLSLPGTDQQILVTSLVVLTLIRVGLWIIPFRMLQRLLGYLFSPPKKAKQPSLPPEKVAWAVRAASRYVPSATCLAQALTVQALLTHHGIRSDLAIGVAREGESPITAHAWLEINGVVIIGGQERDRYCRLVKQD